MHLSLIPLNEINEGQLKKSPDLFSTEENKTNIGIHENLYDKYKINVSYSIMPDKVHKLLNEPLPIITNEAKVLSTETKTILPEKNIKKSLFKYKNIAFGFLVVLILLLISWAIFPSSKNEKPLTKEAQFQKIFNEASHGTPEETIKNRLEAYYEKLKSKDVGQLKYFLNDKLDRWYDKHNVGIETIQRETKSYWKSFPFCEYNVEWNTLKIDKDSNGDFNAIYFMKYKAKQKAEFPFKNFSLKIFATLGADYKIKSMYEENMARIEK
jgi:hypothetical protein